MKHLLRSTGLMALLAGAAGSPAAEIGPGEVKAILEQAMRNYKAIETHDYRVTLRCPELDAILQTAFAAMMSRPW